MKKYLSIKFFRKIIIFSDFIVKNFDTLPYRHSGKDLWPGFQPSRLCYPQTIGRCDCMIDTKESSKSCQRSASKLKGIQGEKRKVIYSCRYTIQRYFHFSKDFIFWRRFTPTLLNFCIFHSTTKYCQFFKFPKKYCSYGKISNYFRTTGTQYLDTEKLNRQVGMILDHHQVPKFCVTS